LGLLGLLRFHRGVLVGLLVGLVEIGLRLIRRRVLTAQLRRKVPDIHLPAGDALAVGFLVSSQRRGFLSFSRGPYITYPRPSRARVAYRRLKPLLA